MMNFQDVRDKSTRGGYNAKVKYPERDAAYIEAKANHKRLKPEEFQKLYPEQVKLLERWQNTVNKYQESLREGEREFKVDLREAFEFALDKKLTDTQWVVVFHNAWEHGHSAGYSEVINYAADLVELVYPFVY